jgi:hypothetical protein
MVRYGEATLFDTYIDPTGMISLTLSGIGKVSAASAVIHTSMLLNNKETNGWLNFGIAGHSFHDIGTPVLANKIIDNVTGNTWYPQILFNTSHQSNTLITLDRPSFNYHDKAMYDMEAAGFFEAACKVSSLELSQCLKIISDNKSHDIKSINKNGVTRLVECNLKTISKVVQELLHLASISDNESYDEIIFLDLINKHHFTYSQKSQLIKQLKRCLVLQAADIPKLAHHSKFRNSSEVLEFFNSTLNEYPYRL